MGQDIHYVFEIKQSDGFWKCKNPRVKLIHRNYALFAWLSNAGRNSMYMNGVMPCKYIKETFPEDATQRAIKLSDWDIAKTGKYTDFHSHSWITLEDLLKVDFTVRHGDFIARKYDIPYEGLQHFLTNFYPWLVGGYDLYLNSWISNGDFSEEKVKRIFEDQDRIIKEINQVVEDIQKQFPQYNDGQAKHQFIRNNWEKYLIWLNQHYGSLADFLGEDIFKVIEYMKTLNKNPDNVRMLMWYDN